MSICRFALVFGALSALPLVAHHELRAEFDAQKPVSLRGMVTRFEWNNPHALLYLDVGTASWTVEWASPLDLRKAGWTRDVLKVGDSVTVEAWLARDGSKLASGRTIVLASGKRLAEGRKRKYRPHARSPNLRRVGPMVIHAWASCLESRATGRIPARPASLRRHPATSG